MGAQVSSIQRIFILQSRIIGFLGALVGTSAGVLIALAIGQYEIPAASSNVYGGISFIPVVVRAQDIMVIIVLVFLLNLLTAVYPARQAAKPDPVKAISTR
jgi:lipoprotein-releasing system permease protein